MENNENKKEKDEKFYLVTLSDGTKKIVEDGFSSEKTEFNQLLEVYAIEENEELRTVIGNKKILDASKNYNQNIFDIKTFIEDNYSLFCVSKTEVDVNDILKKLHFITRSETTKETDAIFALEKATKQEANRQYQLLLEQEKEFTEEINSGRRR